MRRHEWELAEGGWSKVVATTDESGCRVMARGARQGEQLQGDTHAAEISCPSAAKLLKRMGGTLTKCEARSHCEVHALGRMIRVILHSFAIE